MVLVTTTSSSEFILVLMCAGRGEKFFVAVHLSGGKENSIVAYSVRFGVCPFTAERLLFRANVGQKTAHRSRKPLPQKMIHSRSGRRNLGTVNTNWSYQS